MTNDKTARQARTMCRGKLKFAHSPSVPLGSNAIQHETGYLNCELMWGHEGNHRTTVQGKPHEFPNEYPNESTNERMPAPGEVLRRRRSPVS